METNRLKYLLLIPTLFYFSNDVLCVYGN